MGEYPYVRLYLPVDKDLHPLRELSGPQPTLQITGTEDQNHPFELHYMLLLLRYCVTSVCDVEVLRYLGISLSKQHPSVMSMMYKWSPSERVMIMGMPRPGVNLELNIGCLDLEE